jgi:shikimate kinase
VDLDLDHLALIGLMGSGKTTVGTRVARALGRPFVDSDDLLQARTGHTARELFEANGETAMHTAERDALMQAFAAPEANVIGAAASAVLTMADELRRHYVVWLCADPHVLAERVQQQKHRPFVDHDPDVLVRQHEERKALYASVASLTIDTTRGDPDDEAAEIVAQIEPLVRG